MARKAFATWVVGEEEYKLKLTTSKITEVEEKLKVGLMDVLGNARTLPPLKIMLSITHAAMKQFNSGIKEKDVYDIFDKYVEEGGSQLDFFTNVFIDIYKVSGFFTEAQTEQMEEQQEKAQELL